jgi:CHAD domain-containing protein
MPSDSQKPGNSFSLPPLSTSSPENVHQLHEREIKFHVPPRFQIPENVGIPISPRVFTSTYYDSEQHRLSQLGLTLRKRVEGGQGVWQLKILSGKYRIELEIASGSHHIPGQFLDLLTGFFRKHEPVQLGKLRTWRTGRLIQEEGKFVAKVTLDSVALLRENKIISRFREMELELPEGKPAHLTYIRKTLQKAGAKSKSLQPKIFQALQLPYPLADPQVDPTAPPTEHIGARLRAQINQMLIHDPGTRLGRDSEALHQMRVATRRMRAIFRAVRTFLEPEWTKKIRQEVGWIGSLLGEVRDWDVLLESLRKECSALHSKEKRAFLLIQNTFQEERSMARGLLLEGLRSDRYLELLNTLEDSLAHLPFQSNHPTMVDLARKAFARLEECVESTQGRFPKEELHHTRILVKRARYTVELGEPFLPKQAKRFLQQAKSLQEVLGQHQDALVVEHQLLSHRSLTRSLGVAFVKGILVERFRNRQKVARQNLPQLWEKLRKLGKKLQT